MNSKYKVDRLVSGLRRISNDKAKEESTITEWKISFQIKVNKQIDE